MNQRGHRSRSGKRPIRDPKGRVDVAPSEAQPPDLRSRMLLPPKVHERAADLEETTRRLQGRVEDATATIAELRARQSYLGALFENLPSACIVHDATGIILDCNPAASTLLQLPSPAGSHCSLSQFIAREDLPQWLAQFRNCALTRQTTSVQLRLRSGRCEVAVELLTSALPSARRKLPEQFFTLVIDATPHRVVEAALSQTKENYRQLIDTIEGIVWEADLATMDITFVNQRAERLLGYPVQEWTRPGFWESHIYAPDREGVAHQLARAVAEDGHLRVDYRVLTAARKVLWIHDSIRVVERQGHRRLLGVGIDVTEQRRAQEELSEAHARLEERVVARTAELRRTLGELEAFSYSLSHDLRAPLRAMLGFAELALKNGADQSPSVKEYLSRIMAAATRADRLVQDVLTFGRVSRSNFNLTPLNLEAVVDEVVEQSPKLRPCRSHIEVQRPLLPVLGHEVSLRQCLDNLLSNAVKFIQPGAVPEVTVRTEPASNSARPMVRTWVEDKGIGIEPGNLSRIFGIFERVYAQSRYEGTGIGLAIVRKAVERMGGKLGVQSEPGKGSRFWIELPAAK